MAGTSWQVLQDENHFPFRCVAFRDGRIVAEGRGKTRPEAILSARRAMFRSPPVGQAPPWAEAQNKARAARGKPPLDHVAIDARGRALSPPKSTEAKLSAARRGAVIGALLRRSLREGQQWRHARTERKYGHVG